MQASFGVALGIYRTGFARPLGIHVLGCSTYLGRPFQCARRGRRMGWTGGQATHQLEQVISQPLASSTTSPLRHFVPVSLRARLLSTSTSLPVCLSVILPFVPICLLLPAVCLAENHRLPPPPSIASERGHAQTIITQPTAPYFEPRPHCAIGCPTIFRTKDHHRARAHCNEELGC